MKLLRLFQKCVNCEYIHVENSGDYYIERQGSTLYIYLECSNGSTDWKNNLDFLQNHTNEWVGRCGSRTEASLKCGKALKTT